MARLVGDVVLMFLYVPESPFVEDGGVDFCLMEEYLWPL